VEPFDLNWTKTNQLLTQQIKESKKILKLRENCIPS